ncbi:hypothetical protein A2U01_0013917 [Trifolium medium]|uniref:Uncharacterized protein n=1 Tax=Trifolium medium TaxID=97028 RepID=A0A392MZP4_9FABA|nr:hypothetical protein [Trifolium medium]
MQSKFAALYGIILEIGKAGKAVKYASNVGLGGVEVNVSRAASKKCDTGSRRST